MKKKLKERFLYFSYGLISRRVTYLLREIYL